MVLASSTRDLERLAESSAEVCEWFCFKVNVDKSKVVIAEREGESVSNVQVNKRILRWLKNLPTLG